MSPEPLSYHPRLKLICPFPLFQHLQKHDEETAEAAEPLNTKAGPSGPAVTADIEDEEEKDRGKAKESVEEKVYIILSSLNVSLVG